MCDIIKPEDLNDFTIEVTVHKSKLGPHKELSYKIETIVTGIGIQFRETFHVKDYAHKIIYAGDHLTMAIKAYNKLYK